MAFTLSIFGIFNAKNIIDQRMAFILFTMMP